MAKRRIERINELIKREISGIIEREIRDPGVGFVTVSRVETSGDLSYSTIHTSVLGDERKRDRAIECLNKAAGYIQHQLSGRITLRTMPKIIFKLDTSLDASFRIDAILRKISEENPHPPQNGESGEESEETEE